MTAPADLYRGHRFPADVISQVVWLYFRFSVSYRDVEEMMARRGVQLTYETVREWCDKFGPYFAEELRRRNKGKLGSKWYLDEVFLKIKCAVLGANRESLSPTSSGVTVPPNGSCFPTLFTGRAAI